MFPFFFCSNFCDEAFSILQMWLHTFAAIRIYSYHPNIQTKLPKITHCFIVPILNFFLTPSTTSCIIMAPPPPQPTHATPAPNNYIIIKIVAVMM